MFDRYAAATAPSWGRRALVLASIAVHVTAAIVLIVYSICRIEEVPPPALTIRILEWPRPAPPPVAGSSKPKTSAAKRAPVKTPSTPSLVEPQVRQEPTSTQEAPAGTEETGEPSASSDPGGSPEGVPGGDPVGHGTTPARATIAPAFVLMASALHAPDPHLSDAFKNAHAGQSVAGAYKVCLATDGHVTNVSVIASVPSMDDLITSHIRSTWQFKPQALPVCFTKPFRFNIK